MSVIYIESARTRIALALLYSTLNVMSVIGVHLGRMTCFFIKNTILK